MYDGHHLPSVRVSAVDAFCYPRARTREERVWIRDLMRYNCAIRYNGLGQAHRAAKPEGTCEARINDDHHPPCAPDSPAVGLAPVAPVCLAEIF